MFHKNFTTKCHFSQPCKKIMDAISEILGLIILGHVGLLACSEMSEAVGYIGFPSLSLSIPSLRSSHQMGYQPSPPPLPSNVTGLTFRVRSTLHGTLILGSWYHFAVWACAQAQGYQVFIVLERENNSIHWSRQKPKDMLLRALHQAGST